MQLMEVPNKENVFFDEVGRRTWTPGHKDQREKVVDGLRGSVWSSAAIMAASVQLVLDS